jgi:hypothetical protein
MATGGSYKNSAAVILRVAGNRRRGGALNTLEINAFQELAMKKFSAVVLTLAGAVPW